MTSESPIDRAKADLSELEKKINGLLMEISRLQLQADMLHAEKAKIVAFIDLSQRYSGAEETAKKTAEQASKPASHGAAAPLEAAKPRARKSKNKRGSLRVERKPPGAPTTPDMIREAIRDAEAHGEKGASAGRLTTFIRAKYWPAAKSSNISPVAWRMWQDGVLRKNTNGKYIIAAGAESETAAA